MELLGTVVIEEYVRCIELSASRRASYYKKGEKIPKKYSEEIGSNYQWLEKTVPYKGTHKFLCDGYGELVIKNPKSVGTPQWHVLNFQDLHTLRLEQSTRSKILKAVKDQMIPEVAKLPEITKFPIRILCELHDTYMDWMYINKENQPIDMRWDVDNRAGWYMKIFPDVLQGCPMIKEVKENGQKIKKVIYLSRRVIPEDHRGYITQPPVPVFTPIDDTTKRKLVFKIYHDDREVIKNSKWYDNTEKKTI